MIIPLSVRSLVEYVYRSGSIESGFMTMTPLSEGTKAHQKLQNEYKETDRKEVQLKADLEAGGILFALEGRCDGLLQTGEDSWTIEEIKSTSREVGSYTADRYPVHWAQAKCYAYLYALLNGVSRMGVRLTYVQVPGGELNRFQVEHSFAELEEFVNGLLQSFLPYAEWTIRHQRERDASIKELSFPFPAYREGQRKLAGAVYTAVREGRNLFAKAPTGIGKTISTLFPSVKAVGEGLLQRIFYITAKTITRTAAEDAFRLMTDRGLRMTTVTITAKEKVCFQEQPICTKEHCEFADGYYDRINEAVLDTLTHAGALTRQEIETYARKHRVCPFEFSLDLAYAADAVICDYNYVFDPRVSLKRFGDDQRKQTVLLVDEAHNLVDRARSMFSAELAKSGFLALKRDYKGRAAGVSQAAGAVNDSLLALRKEEDKREWVRRDPPEELPERLTAFAAEAEKELIQGGTEESRELLLETYFAVQGYLRILKGYDERYLTCVEHKGSEVRLKLFCVDPSKQLSQTGKGYRARIYFSATLSPMSYFLDLLGGTEEDYTLSIPSPFSPEQWDVRMVPLSTRFRDRPRSLIPISRSIRRLAAERGGNMLVFFPSFEYRDAVYEAFAQEDAEDYNLLLQGSSMSEEERERFLEAFRSTPERPLIGFAVMGGIFSEGIDLQGDRLTTVMIIGVGLPQLSFERDVIKRHFAKMGKNGYDYAYVYPGMNKVLQAGGRLIRSETDKGTLVLVDDRFLQPHYRSMMPAEWRNGRIVNESSLS
ncbi:ATP-dependent DNA helicase [Paenibacillus aurantius]|uniref:ATP-dependent DNA helicase n=1 Tax=Paenibacillus aurantius TaxID=2918900 RepID=A0AA96LIZ3_9BACL|nr:ATP-dependent DNA helicase [Paenibacillus aurantius]WNQ13863.1 ATP-dependent DNA helicase [Paenibacillus aurantius]